ncbi:MAG: succinate dehydrogenase [Fimbriimonadaceae bacterium]|nr:succinate dehydrogenase [Fimbriimonadaceae bacterium]
MRENYLLHKLHSLTGIVPIGFYLVQHLTLNTFSLGGPEKFNGVIAFFDAMPLHFQVALKAVAIWIPLIFHAVYGLFITQRSKQNYTEPAYRFRENRYYTLQRVTGIIAFLFLCYHMTTTSIFGKMYGAEATIQYHNWAGTLSQPVLGVPYVILAVYIIGVVACAYHFSYGIWNFCIRWGITVSQRAQDSTAKLAQAMFIGVSLLGIVALLGFFNPIFQSSEAIEAKSPAVSQEGPVEL